MTDERVNEVTDLCDPSDLADEADGLWSTCLKCEHKVFFTLHCTLALREQAQSLSPKTRLSPWNFFFFPLLPYETDRPDMSPIGAVALDV
jgi:hypothetical protein